MSRALRTFSDKGGGGRSREAPPHDDCLRDDMRRIVEECLTAQDLQLLNREMQFSSDFAKILVKITLYLIGINEIRAILVPFPIPTIILRHSLKRSDDAEQTTTMLVSTTSLCRYLFTDGGYRATRTLQTSATRPKRAAAATDIYSELLTDVGAACGDRKYNDENDYETANNNNATRRSLNSAHSPRVRYWLVKLISVANANYEQFIPLNGVYDGELQIRNSPPMAPFADILHSSMAASVAMRHYLKC